MTEFDELISKGFQAVLDATSAPSITAPNGQTAKGVSTPVGESKDLRDQGYWPKFHTIFEMTRADFRRLKLTDRAPVVFREACEPATSPGRTLKVIAMEPDSADPCIKITLKEDPQPGVIP